MLCCAAFGAAMTPAWAADALTLWYSAPATDWEQQGLPIGNGAMGAVVTGQVATDEIQFNEKTLWTGGPGAVGGYNGSLPEKPETKALADVRALLGKDPKLAPEVAAKMLGQDEKSPGDYQNFGSLMLHFADPSAQVTDYRRSLDIGKAVAQVEYRAGGVQYRRTYFTSYPDGVIVIKLEADKPGHISFKADFAIPDNRSVKAVAHGGRVSVTGALKDNGLKYEAAAQVLNQGGTRQDADGAVTVSGANTVIVILKAGTNYAVKYPEYRGADPHAGLSAALDQAAAKSYDVLLARHEKDYGALFDRMHLNIGQAMPDVPTDKALADYKQNNAGGEARAVEALFFQYGRYLLIASSRAGSLPANLQGVWNHSNTPPWSDDYHVNINIQMNYWPADQANLAETAVPFYDFVDSLVVPGRVAAERVMGTKGWTLFLKTNIWGQTGLISWPTAFWQPEAGAWLASQYYDHYRYSKDVTFLKTRAYPVMKEAAELWLEALIPDPRDGSLVVSPSYSPEHGPFSNGAAMAQQVVYGLFTDVAEAAAVVGDTGFRAKVLAAQTALDPGLKIGSWGQLQEWKEDWDDPKDDHRHTSHLYGLHPGRQISPAATPDFAAAARVTLKARGDSLTSHGEGGTGWSKAWKVNFWARLGDGDHSYSIYSRLVRENAMANLWDAYVTPPFQIDGNFGATAGVCEMLVQSQTDEIALLPALPSAWPEGSVQGIRARGDVTIDLSWKNAKAVSATLRAGKDGVLKIRSSLFSGRFSLTDRASGRPVAVTGSGALRVLTVKAGHQYQLSAI